MSTAVVQLLPTEVLEFVQMKEAVSSVNAADL